MSRPLSLDDLPRIVALSDPRISPDGRQVAYVAETVDLDANQSRSAIWLVDCQGGPPRQLTAGTRARQRAALVAGRAHARVRLRPGRQPPALPAAARRRRSAQLTEHPVGVAGPAWSPDGRSLLFLADGADRRGDPVPRGREGRPPAADDDPPSTATSTTARASSGRPAGTSGRSTSTARPAS